MSFRLRLTLLAALAIAVTVAGASAALWAVAKHELRGQVDDTLAARADSIAHHEVFGPYERTTLYEVITPQGGVSGFALPVTGRAKGVASGKSGYYYTDVVLQGHHLRELVAPVGPGTGTAVIVAEPLQETDRALHRIGFWIVLIGGGGVALAAALAAFVAAAALRPVRRLTAAAEHVAATGNLSERVHVAGDDELGRLATRFNEMLEALERSVGAQRRLVADASHELRTPLTAIRTNLELLREGKLPEDEERHALEESSVELDSLTTLVADLTELARGEERKLRVENVALDDLVATAVERAKARSPHMTFVTALSPTQVRADPVLLERAISNLLDNAVKWSPEGGPVEVTVREGEVVVADHGPGIAEEDLPRVFDRFYRAATARSKPGSGLGLAIVREAATAHGGTATAENGATGARFRLSLPATA
jgi:two-component system, OmpR family, sensor histidine kinase MprB